MPSFSTLARTSRTLASSRKAPTWTTKRPPLAAASGGLVAALSDRIAAGDAFDGAAGGGSTGPAVCKADAGFEALAVAADAAAGLTGLAAGLACEAAASVPFIDGAT